MNIPTLAFGLALVALPTLSQAACIGESLMSCPTRNGRVLQVCASDDTFSYDYGRPGQSAELSLTRPVDAAAVTPWNGMGMDQDSSVTFRNGAHFYTAWVSDVRGDSAAPTSGGILVQKGDITLTTVGCVMGQVTARNGGASFEQAMEERGWCWNLSETGWQKGGC